MSTCSTDPSADQQEMKVLEQVSDARALFTYQIHPLQSALAISMRLNCDHPTSLYVTINSTC